MNLVNILTISSLKIRSSALSVNAQELLIEAASSLLVSKSIKDQAESPLFVALVRF